MYIWTLYIWMCKSGLTFMHNMSFFQKFNANWDDSKYSNYNDPQ